MIFDLANFYKSSKNICKEDLLINLSFLIINGYANHPVFKYLN